MKTTIKQLLDPRQQTKGNTTSSKGKESEMKNRMISKKAILGLAIGTGLIAGFSVLLSGSETRAFNPAETVNSVNTGMVMDESQEVGVYLASKRILVQSMEAFRTRRLILFPSLPRSPTRGTRQCIIRPAEGQRSGLRT